MEAPNPDIIHMLTPDDYAELEQMRERLKELEKEAATLREMQSKNEKEMGAVLLLLKQKFPRFVADPAASVATNQAGNAEVDARSVYVANVAYACTPEEVQQHFQTCGTVNRVAVRQPKGYAFVEFTDVEAVQQALQLNGSELHGRQLMVEPKRTNVPGMGPPGSFNPSMGYHFQGPFVLPPFISPPFVPPPYSPYGYGMAPRFRRPNGQ